MALTYPDIDPIALQIGPLALRWYSLAYIVGLIGGWWQLRRMAERAPSGAFKAIDTDDFLSWATFGVIFGGRIGYVLFYNLDHYLAYPMDALKLWQGGMSFHGGALGVILALILFVRARKLDLFVCGDILTCVTPLGLLFGRIANFINGELYGRTSDAAWAMVFPMGGPLPRHPSQLYEASLEGVALYALTNLLWHNRSIRKRPGLVAGVFLIGYALARTFVEQFREPDAQLGFIFFNVTMGMILSIPMLVFGAWLIVRALRRDAIALPE